MKLTLDEKLRLVSGVGFWHTNTANGKLPSLHLSDGPHGLRKAIDGATNNDSVLATCFPTASAVASCWNPELANLMGKSIAYEAFNEEVSILLGPGVNMKRSPLCGRNFEYYAEDPYLAGKLGISFVRGVQEIGVGTSLKHFCANSQETLRFTSNSMVDDRALREVYLRAFEMVVKNANPATVMASYNRIDGTYSTENKRLLTDILRKEWGYKGLVVSDWGACIQLPSAIKAGMDLEMPDSHDAHYNQLKRALASGTITEADIDIAVNRVIEMGKNYAVENRTRKEKYDTSMNHQNAVLVEEESAILLENDGILPLSTRKITIIGGLAKTVRYQGGGSSHIHTNRVLDAVEAFKKDGYTIQYAEGYSAQNSLVDEKLEAEAMDVIQKDDTVLFFGGLPEFAEGEGYDRTTLDMPENQVSLFNKLYAKNKNIIFISFGGAPYTISFKDKCRAILHMYLGGEGVMEACSHIVSGKVCPSGHLAETFPLCIEDTPAYGEFATGSKDVKYKESIFIGYRYYDTFHVPVAYPFGYGLSYTNFRYSDLKVNKNSVTVTIENIGKISGKEVVQVYVAPKGGDYYKATKELKGFAKVLVEAGKKVIVEIPLDDHTFMVYDKALGFVTPKGEYDILVGASSRDIRLSETIVVDGIDYKTKDREAYPYFFDINGKLRNITDEQFAAYYGKEISHLDDITVGEFSLYNSLGDIAPYSKIAAEELKKGLAKNRARFIDKPDDDPELVMFNKVLTEGNLDCIQMQGDIPYYVIEAMILEANGHEEEAQEKLKNKE